MPDLRRKLYMRSYLVSGFGIVTAKKDRDLFDVQWTLLMV